MRTIYRYRTAKPADGHFNFLLHQDATVLSFVEHWHTEKGWETLVDVMVDSSKPTERRYFFLCNAGDPLDFLGEVPEAYFVGMHDAKSYVSYLFDTTHLSETQRQQGKIERSRYVRKKPTLDELSRTGRQFERGRA